jgi:hypothetical protein
MMEVNNQQLRIRLLLGLDDRREIFRQESQTVVVGNMNILADLRMEGLKVMIAESLMVLVLELEMGMAKTNPKEKLVLHTASEQKV